MKQLESRVIQRPKVHVGLMIASLLLSMLLWAVVYPQHIPSEKSRSLSAKVSYVGLPDNLIVTDQPETMTVYATGTAEQLRNIDPDRLEFVVSLADAKNGRRKYVATVTPAAYQQFFPEEQSAPFTIEELTNRIVNVRAEPQGQLTDDALAVDDYVYDPQQVTATGPKSQIDKLASARVRVDLSNIVIGGENAKYLAVEAVLDDGSVSEAINFEPRVVKVLPVISTAPISKTISVVEDVTGTIPHGYVNAGIEISPNTITIRGSARAVSGINSIVTQPINIQDLTATKEFVAPLKVPRGISLVGASKSVKVKIIINKVPEPSTADPGNTTTPP